MLRLIVNKAKHHFNQGLEYAERGRIDDAIAELRNAIELDASLVDAHVVLGTLYAKKEQFDDARRCWNDALALDHRMLKAHQYLDKARTADYVFPALRRLRAACLALAACLVLAVGAAVWFALPRPGVVDLREAYRLALGNPPNPERALAILDELDRRKGVSAVAREFSQRLHEYLDNARAQQELAWNERINRAAEALEMGAPYLTFRWLDRFEDEQPPETIRQTVARLRERAAERQLQAVREAAAACSEGLRPFADLEREAERFLMYSTSEELKSEVRALVETARAEDTRRARAEAIAAVRTAPTAAEAVQQALAWIGRRPELESELREWLDARLRVACHEVEGEVARLSEAGDYAQARAAVETLALLYRSARMAEPQALLERLRAAVDDAQRRAALAAAEAAFAERRWDAFLRQTADLDALTSGSLERARWEEMRARAQRALAETYWAWFQQLDPRFETASITAEEAALALERLDLTLNHLPPALGARGPLLFYAAVAHFKRGDVAQARALLDQVERDHPRSYIMRSVRAFRRRFADQLGGVSATDAPTTDTAATTPTQR